MFVASWSFDMQFGAREETMRALKEFQLKPEHGWRAKRSRLLVGSIGTPESRVVNEYEFASLADLEASWDALHKQPELFTKWVARMKGLIVAGSARWEIYRVIES